MDGSGTIATSERHKESYNGIPATGLTNGLTIGDETTAVPINENLFLDEDLDALDDELEDLDLDK